MASHTRKERGGRKDEGDRERGREKDRERERRKMISHCTHTSTYVYTSNDMMNLLEVICSNVDFEVKL